RALGRRSVGRLDGVARDRRAVVPRSGPVQDDLPVTDLLDARRGGPLRDADDVHREPALDLAAGVAGGVHDGERDDAAADEVLTGRDGHRVTVRGRVDGARLGLRRDDLHRFAGERVVGAVQDGDGDRLTLFERAEVTVLHAGQRTVRGNDAGDDGAGHRVVDRVGDRDPDVVLGIGRGVGGG